MQEDTRLVAHVLAENVWAPRIEAREVEKPQRRPVYFEPRSIPPRAPLVEVPVRDIQRGVAQDVGCVVGRGEIDHALVDMQSFLDRHDAVASQVRVPPVEEGPRLRSDRDEAQVEDSGFCYVLLSRTSTVRGDRGKAVRREDDAVLARERGDVVKRREHLDVRIEVENRSGALIEE